MTYYDRDGITVYAGDCLDVLRELPDCSVDSVVTDPPYGLGFMGREWDALPPGEEWARACLRVLKPGGHLIAFGGSRTWHRLAVAIEDGGFELRDSIAWLYGSGFPKSLDVSKAIDKQRDDKAGVLAVTSRLADLADAAGITRADIDAHMETSDMGGWWLSRLKHRCACPSVDNWTRLRDFIPGAPELDEQVWHLNGRKGSPGEAWGLREVTGSATGYKAHYGGAEPQSREFDITKAHTPEAEQWQGWGTALKPAFEPVVVARKPLQGTVASNVLQWGCGALNINASRIGPTSGSSQGGGREAGARGCAVHPVRHLRDDDTEASLDRGPAEVAEHLRPEVHGSIDERPAESELVGRSLDEQAGRVPVLADQPALGRGQGPTAHAGPEGDSGAQASRRPEGWSATTGERDGASHQRREGGQPPGEPAPDRLGGTLPGAPLDRAGVDRASGRERASSGCTCAPNVTTDGRWPANVVLDESQAEALDQMSGTLTSGRLDRAGITAENAIYGAAPAERTGIYEADTGGASRFFYTAKADASERVRLPRAGAEGGVIDHRMKTRQCNVCGSKRKPAGGEQSGKPWPTCGHDDWSMGDTATPGTGYNAHPTVKPLSLMRWLVRLVTPPGGVVLEPFAGSGTTVEACLLEGFDCIAIEREADYLPLIVQRINRRRDPVAAVLSQGEDAGLFDLLGEGA